MPCPESHFFRIQWAESGREIAYRKKELSLCLICDNFEINPFYIKGRVYSFKLPLRYKYSLIFSRRWKT